MQTIENTASFIHISNGFESGEAVHFIEKREGKWVEVGCVSTGECTWVGDKHVVDLEVDITGKAGYHIEWSRGVKYFRGFFGIPEEELNGPPPEKGYMTERGQNTFSWEEVNTYRDWLHATLRGNFKAWRDLGDGVHQMPYHWGDQPADSFALVKGGKLIDSVTGCGDQTPYLTESNEKCMQDEVLHTSCPMSDWVSFDEDGPTEAELANQRADADETGILRRLLKHYRKRQNPLRSLRKEKGGVWTFHREYPEVGPDTVIYYGEGWWVTWKK